MAHQIISPKYILGKSNYPLSLLPQLKHWSKSNYDCNSNNMANRHSIEHEHFYQWYRDQNWNETQNSKSRTSLISRQSFWRWWIFDEISRMIRKLFCPAGISTREKKKWKKKTDSEAFVSIRDSIRALFFRRAPLSRKKMTCQNWASSIQLSPRGNSKHESAAELQIVIGALLFEADF